MRCCNIILWSSRAKTKPRVIHGPFFLLGPSFTTAHKKASPLPFIRPQSHATAGRQQDMPRYSLRLAGNRQHHDQFCSASLNLSVETTSTGRFPACSRSKRRPPCTVFRIFVPPPKHLFTTRVKSTGGVAPPALSGNSVDFKTLAVLIPASFHARIPMHTACIKCIKSNGQFGRNPFRVRMLSS